MPITRFSDFYLPSIQPLTNLTGRAEQSRGVWFGVGPLTKSDRVCAIAAAAAHDLNDELTVILSSVTSSIRALEPGHPAREMLLDLQSAAQRCAWKASGLLNFSARRGARPSAATFERLVEEER